MSSKVTSGLFALGLLVVGVMTLLFSPLSAKALEPAERVCLEAADLLPALRQKPPKQDAVRNLQMFLISEGHLSTLKEDEYGTLGRKTRLAITSFQKSQGLEPVGYVGRFTADRIQKISCEGSSPETSTTTSSQNKNSNGSATDEVTIEPSSKASRVSMPTPPRPLADGRQWVYLEVTNETTGVSVNTGYLYEIPDFSLRPTLLAKAGDIIKYRYEASGQNELLFLGYGYDWISGGFCDFNSVLSSSRPNIAPTTPRANTEGSGSFKLIRCQGNNEYMPNWDVVLYTIGGTQGDTWPYNRSALAQVEILYSDPNPVVSYPNGGETFSEGTPVYLSWNGFGSVAVDLFLKHTGGEVYLLKRNIPPEPTSRQTVVWTADPSVFSHPEKTFLLRACRTGTSICDDGDSPFTITSASSVTPKITLYANGVTGDEVLYVNRDETITYELRTEGNVSLIPENNGYSAWYYILNGYSHCGGPRTGDWTPPPLGGSRPDKVDKCQEGNTYRLVYVPFAKDNVIIDSSYVTVHVNSKSPSAKLWVDGGNETTVSAGRYVYYEWFSEGNNLKPSSMYVSDQPACGMPTTGRWVVDTTSGTRSDEVKECQGGRSYTLTFAVVDSEGQEANSSATVKVRPTISFTANGQKDITVGSTDKVDYALTAYPSDAASRVTNASATYTRVSPDNCTFPSTGSWTPPPLNGSRPDQVGDCQKGGVYNIVYRYTLDGFTEEKTVTVRIRSDVSSANLGARVLGSVYQGFNWLFGNGRLETR